MPSFSSAQEDVKPYVACVFELSAGADEDELVRDLSTGYLARMVSIIETVSMVSLRSPDGLKKAMNVMAGRLSPAQKFSFPRYKADDGQAISAFLNSGTGAKQAVWRFIIGWKTLTYQWMGRDADHPWLNMMTLESDLNLLQDWIQAQNQNVTLNLQSVKDDLRALGITEQEYKGLRESFRGVIMYDGSPPWTVLIRRIQTPRFSRDESLMAILSPRSTPRRIRIEKIKPEEPNPNYVAVLGIRPPISSAFTASRGTYDSG